MRSKVEVLCCGKSCRTKFCPHCGNQTPDNPLASLFLYVKDMAKTLRTRLNNMKESGPRCSYTTDEEHQAVVGRYAEKVDRWDSWVDALSTIVGGVNGHAK